MTRTPAQLDKVASRIIARVLASSDCGSRAEVLACMIAHSAAGLRIIRGPEEAAMAVYAVADQLVSKETA